VNQTASYTVDGVWNGVSASRDAPAFNPTGMDALVHLDRGKIYCSAIWRTRCNSGGLQQNQAALPDDRHFLSGRLIAGNCRIPKSFEHK